MNIEIQIISKQPSASNDLPIDSDQINCVEKISFQSSTNIFTTSAELVLLRHCAESIKDEPNRSLKIVAAGYTKKIAFIAKTLTHLGVSCAQISHAEIAV